MRYEHAVPQDDGLAYNSHQRGSNGGIIEFEQGQVTGREHDPIERNTKSCQQGDTCELKDSRKKGWYNSLRRFPAYLSRHVHYRHANWISTRELGRKLDQMEQFTHHHTSEDEITENHFILLDARGQKEYRTNHIHGAIHLPTSAHLCTFVRPGSGHVQRHFFDPPRNTPLYASKDKPILTLLENIDKGTEVVVYCSVGHRSGWIASALRKQGYNVSAVSGGMYKWANEGRDIFKFRSDPENDGKKDSKKSKFTKARPPKTKKESEQETVPTRVNRSKSDSSKALMETTDSQGMYANSEFTHQIEPISV